MELANTILTEYHNSGDSWESAMSNLDALLALRPQPDASGPGYFSDGASHDASPPPLRSSRARARHLAHVSCIGAGDMLNTCNFGNGKKGAGSELPLLAADALSWLTLALMSPMAVASQ